MKASFSVAWRFGVALILFVALIYAVVSLEADPYIQDIEALPHVRTAIVLGAGISSTGKVSDVLKDRLDGAIALYRTGVVDVILVSGDNGTLEHNEVKPSREYLLTNNIPSDVIFLDHAGFDTYSSMYRAREVFLVDKAIIVTQPFHLSRAVFIARRLGIEAYGLASDQHRYSIKYSLRELLANVKAFSDVLYGRIPKYLGDEIPITGDSSQSI